MTAASELNSSLNSQCMDFCQALARQGLEFKFSVTIGSAFTFSLDARAKEGRDAPPSRRGTALLHGGEMRGAGRNISRENFHLKLPKQILQKGTRSSRVMVFIVTYVILHLNQKMV